jgi:hypothetical protein
MSKTFKVFSKKKISVGSNQYIEPHMNVIVKQNGVNKPERPNVQKAFEELLNKKIAFSLNLNDFEWDEI